MTKKYSTWITGLFVLFITGTLVAHLVVPDGEFSSVENRYLEGFPVLSVESVTSGEFMTEFETYTTDQFPVRDLWVSMKAWSERLTGKQENNGVYLADENTLINHLDEPDVDALDKAAGYLNKLGIKSEVPVYFGLIPTAAEVWRDRLPNGAPTADELAAIARVYDQLDGVDTLDMYNTLAEHGDEGLFYRTDHHWTTLGAYYGYTAIVEAMGMTPVSLEAYTAETVSDAFYGTSFSTSGVRWLQPDTIERYVPDVGLTVTSYATGMPEESELYHPDFLEKKDKYGYFLGGNQPLCIIETEHTDAPSVLIVRDSYSDSMAPFLTEHFSEIHLLDLRYYNMGVSTYIEQNDIDNVVVLYSMSNFATDINLFKLGM